MTLRDVDDRRFRYGVRNPGVVDLHLSPYPLRRAKWCKFPGGWNKPAFIIR
jgi:hypothetical protein